MSYVIGCNALTKQYKEKAALDGISLSVEENKIIGLVGRNGAGKTTFLKACAGYIRPTSGEIKVLGTRPFDNLGTVSETVYISESTQYDEPLKLDEILIIAGIYYRNWDGAFAGKMMKYFELDGRRKFAKLSRGTKTLFNLILALAGRSRLTLLDEPTLGLDTAVRKEIYKIILNDYMEHPRTIVISSHLMNEIENIPDEMILIHEGKLVFHKPMEALQGYAVCINGKKDILAPFLAGKHVLNREDFGNSVLAGVQNDLTKEEWDYLEKSGANISRAKVDDVLIWLTSNGKGGGFDEFEG